MGARRVLAVLGPVLILVLGLSALPAHAHGAGAHDRVVQAEPAVVHIETSAKAQVVLHDMGRPIFLQRATYDVPTLSSGTGIVVNPSGTVVTTNSAVAADLTRAETYAANKIFSQYYHVTVPGDPFAKHRLSDSTNDQRLQHCYETHELYMQGPNCVVFVTPQVRVFPFVTRPTRGGLPAEVLRSGTSSEDVAVVSINGTDLPTAAISTTRQPATAVSTIGFLSAPTAATTPVTANAHLAPPGASQFTAKDLALVQQGLGAKTAGVPVINADNGSVVALLGGNPTVPTLIPAEKINAALRSLGIQARTSLVDNVFADANAYYGHGHFTHAVPRLQEVLRLDPDTALAAQMLTAAKKQQGTAADDSREGLTAAQPPGSASKDSAVSGWLIALYVLLGLLVVALLLTFRFGRRLTSAAKAVRRSPSPRFGRRLTSAAKAIRRSPPPQATSGVTPAAGDPAAGDQAAAGASTAPEPGSAPGPGASHPGTSQSGKSRSVPAPGLGQRVLDLTVHRPRAPLDPSAGPGPDSSAERAPDQPAAASGAQPMPADQLRPSGTFAATMTGQRFCTQCGSRAGSQHRFCSGCGNELE